jgi:hypothetical protein
MPQGLLVRRDLSVSPQTLKVETPRPRDPETDEDVDIEDRVEEEESTGDTSFCSDQGEDQQV